MPKRDVVKRAPRHRFVSINEVRLTGHLTHDAELRYTPDGKAICQFQVGTNIPLRGTKGQRAKTFTQIATFGAIAVRASQLRKGLPVYITGRLQDSRWLAGTRWVRTIRVVADQILRLTEDEPNDITSLDDNADEGSQPQPTPRSRRTRTTAAAPVDPAPPAPASRTRSPRKRPVIRDSGDVDAG